MSEPFNFDKQGWNIDIEALPTPTRGISPYIFLTDKLFESADTTYACLFYTVTEFRMGSYAGLIAIFENKNNPTLVVNPKNQWFDYQGDNSIYFFDDLVFVRKLAYNQNEKMSGTPFVIFDLKNHRFGFIDFDWSSIYYSIRKISATAFEFHPDALEELKRVTLKRNYEQFDVSSIKYYPLGQVSNLTELYFEEKKGVINQ